MFTVVPDYYKDFHCIAGKCRHTCCKGWEIDIDSDSLIRFQRDGIGHISEEGDPHFILDSEERCPFLNRENLCDLIIEHGEGYLCQICRDHPRFRSFWETGEEIGLGLCCEAAAELVLNRDNPMGLLYSDSETGLSVTAQTFSESLPEDEAELFMVRNDLLSKAVSLPNPIKRFREYLLFRHVPNALYDDRLKERVAFAEETTNIMLKRWQEDTNRTVAALCAMVRDFSENVEYDDEALDEILDASERERREMINGYIKSFNQL